MSYIDIELQELQLKVAEAALVDAEAKLGTAKSELIFAHHSFACANPLDSLEEAGAVLRAETNLRSAAARFRHARERVILRNLVLMSQAAIEVTREATLCAVRQSHAVFMAREASDSGDGWKWPVRIMNAGFANGSVTLPDGQRAQLPHYFPPAIVAEVAQEAEGARFRRKHPETGDGSDAPELIAGWLTDSKMQGSSALATVNLLHSAADIRSMLLAAQEAGKMDLFGVSIFAYFGFTKSQAEGRPTLVATSLGRLVALDMCGEPGAGGRFLGGA